MKRSVGRTLLATVILALTAAVPGPAADKPKERAAVQAAEDWLALVDAGRYADSWEECASLFRRQVTKKQWQQMAAAVRGPLGALQSRRLASATHFTTLPGAPDGDYVVIQFETSFANKGSAVETITPMLDDDGEWRVSGYYIR